MSPHRTSRVRSLQPTAIIWLVVVWLALWGDVSVFLLLGGLVVALVICLVFPLPPLRTNVRVRPRWLAWLALHFLGDVVAATWQVARTTIRFGEQPRNAVIEVSLRTHSDMVVTIVGELVSLVPGSIVVEVRRSTSTLFLHVLDAGDEAGVERARQKVYAVERRVVLALGADTTPIQTPPEASP